MGAVPEIEQQEQTARRRGAPALATAQARFAREWWSTRNAARWPEPPAGEGRTAMLIPGFMAGDPSLSRMARWLRSGGFSTTRSGVALNVGCTERTLSQLEKRLEQTVAGTGTPALLIGQSRGGVMARILAVRRPDLVQGLVTLGSPVADPLGVHRHVLLSIGVVGTLGTLGVQQCFSLNCWRGDCCAPVGHDLAAPVPRSVDYLAFYSRRDEIVRWRTCLDPAAENIEVAGTHVGMALDRGLWERLRDEL